MTVMTGVRHERSAAPGVGATPRPAEDVEAAQRAAQHAEIADLTRRVVVGALLTAPVLYAVMAASFDARWVPALLLNHWVQLALTTPRDVLRWLAHSSHRMVGACPPQRRYE